MVKDLSCLLLLSHATATEILAMCDYNSARSFLVEYHSVLSVLFSQILLSVLLSDCLYCWNLAHLVVCFFFWLINFQSVLRILNNNTKHYVLHHPTPISNVVYPTLNASLHNLVFQDSTFFFFSDDIQYIPILSQNTQSSPLTYDCVLINNTPRAHPPSHTWYTRLTHNVHHTLILFLLVYIPLLVKIRKGVSQQSLRYHWYQIYYTYIYWTMIIQMCECRYIAIASIV